MAAAHGESGDCLWDRLAGLFAAWDQTVPWGLPLLSLDHVSRIARRGAAPPALRVPDGFLAAAIDALARHCDPASGKLAFRDYRAADVRLLGAIHESLSQCRLVMGSGKGDRPLVLVRDKAGRKAAGSYYTPDAIVRMIVQETIGPLVDRKLAAAGESGYAGDLFDDLLDFRVLDPAMGCGYFLLAAAEFLTGRLHRFLTRRGRRIARPLVNRRVVERCLYGVDLDPWAVALAKASVWLDSTAPGEPPPAHLDCHLRRGNALVDGTLEGLPTAAGFDAVIGNPPYRGVRTGTIDRALAEYVVPHYAAARGNWDMAALFLEKSLAVGKTAGACGFILPRGSAPTAISPGCGSRFSQSAARPRCRLRAGLRRSRRAGLDRDGGPSAAGPPRYVWGGVKTAVAGRPGSCPERCCSRCPTARCSARSGWRKCRCLTNSGRHRSAGPIGRHLPRHGMRQQRSRISPPAKRPGFCRSFPGNPCTSFASSRRGCSCGRD